MRAGAIAEADVKGREVKFSYVVGGSDIFTFSGVKEAGEAATCMGRMHIRVNVKSNGNKAIEEKNFKKRVKSLDGKHDESRKELQVKSTGRISSARHINVRNQQLQRSGQKNSHDFEIGTNSSVATTQIESSQQSSYVSLSSEYNCTILYAHKTYECILSMNQHNIRCLRTSTSLEIFRLTYSQIGALMLEKITPNTRKANSIQDIYNKQQYDPPTISFLLTNGKYFVAKFSMVSLAKACIDDITRRGGVRILEAYDYEPIGRTKTGSGLQSSSVLSRSRSASSSRVPSKSTSASERSSRTKTVSSDSFERKSKTVECEKVNHNLHNERINATSPIEKMNREINNSQKSQVEKKEEVFEIINKNELAFNAPIIQANEVNKKVDAVVREFDKCFEDEQKKENIENDYTDKPLDSHDLEDDGIIKNEKITSALDIQDSVDPEYPKAKKDSKEVVEVDIKNEDDVSIRVTQKQDIETNQTTESIHSTTESPLHSTEDHSSSSSSSSSSTPSPSIRHSRGSEDGTNEDLGKHGKQEIEKHSNIIENENKEDSVIQVEKNEEEKPEEKYDNTGENNSDMLTASETIDSTQSTHSYPNIEGIENFSLIIPVQEIENLPPSQNLSKSYSKRELDTQFMKTKIPTKGDILAYSETLSDGLENEAGVPSHWSLKSCSIKISAESTVIEISGTELEIPKDSIVKILTGIDNRVDAFKDVRDIVDESSADKSLTLVIRDGQGNSRAVFILFKIQLYQKKLLEALLLQVAYRDNPSGFEQ